MAASFKAREQLYCLEGEANMTDQALFAAAWHYKGGFLMREVFTEALGLQQGSVAFKAYDTSSHERLPKKVRSHWEPKLKNVEERKTLAA